MIGARGLTGSELEQCIIDRFAPHYGKHQIALARNYGIVGLPKNVNSVIVSRILGLESDTASDGDLKRENIIVRTIRLRTDGSIKEHLSFTPINFIDICETSWEHSEFYRTLTKRFLFVVFQSDGEDRWVLRKAFFWSMPLKDLEEAHKVWSRTVACLTRGVRTVLTSRGMTNDLPKATENRVAHVRPHALNSADVAFLPTGGTLTKQSFWLHRKYVEEVIDSNW